MSTAREFEGLDGVALGARAVGRRVPRCFARRRFARWHLTTRQRLGLLRGAREQFGEPSRAPAASLCRAQRGRLRPAGRHDGSSHSGDVRALAGRIRPRAAVGSGRLLATTGARRTGIDWLGPACNRLGRLHPANGGVGRLHPARRLDRVEAAAVAGDDAVELGQRLDLVDDDASHVGGGLGRLLRQLEYPLAQLGARALELLLHLGGHLLQTVEHLGEPLRRLREHRVRTPRRPARRCCAWPRPAVGAPPRPRCGSVRNSR